VVSQVFSEVTKPSFSGQKSKLRVETVVQLWKRESWTGSPELMKEKGKEPLSGILTGVDT
jgi:hypothetical protein